MDGRVPASDASTSGPKSGGFSVHEDSVSGLILAEVLRPVHTSARSHTRIRLAGPPQVAVGADGVDRIVGQEWIRAVYC